MYNDIINTNISKEDNNKILKRVLKFKDYKVKIMIKGTTSYLSD